MLTILTCYVSTTAPSFASARHASMEEVMRDKRTHSMISCALLQDQTGIVRTNQSNPWLICKVEQIDYLRYNRINL